MLSLDTIGQILWLHGEKRRRGCSTDPEAGSRFWFPGVEPTNNASERALRQAVIWRRISGGTDSAQGSRFVERMLTVLATCRPQGSNVLDYLGTSGIDRKYKEGVGLRLA